MPGQHLARRLLNPLRYGGWLTQDRVIAWSTVLLIEELLFFAFLILWNHGVLISPGNNGGSTDFVSFYAAGKLALAGAPALAYDQAAHFLAQQQATDVDATYQYFFYPPVFLMLCAVLARLPYLVAFVLFQAATLMPFVLVMRRILGERDWRWLAPLLAFPAVFWTLGLGQNAFLTAALFGGFTLLLDRRPASAGVVLGMICYKPHFGLLAPIVLLASRRWTAFFSALATVVALVGLSVLLFGWDTWRAYLIALVGSHAVYGTGAVTYAAFVTPFGAARLLGFDPWVGYGVQAFATIAVAGLTVLVWRRSLNASLRSATLLSGTLVAVPLALVYDKLILLVAIVWLLREAREHGYLSYEKLVLFLTYPAVLVSVPLAAGWHVPIGPILTSAIMVLCFRRVWQTLATQHDTVVAGAVAA
jgi:alpha-1,2-mannosyltransferase